MPRADELRRGPVQTPAKISLQEEKARQKSREEYLQSQVNMLWRTLPKREEEKTVAEARRYPSEPQENLLYFMEKNAPLLESWQREILRIVRKVSQYFYPQNRLR
ncbi:SpoVR family protein [Escherichia coli]|nr:SpoVR family protein [Escherichia coli]